VGFSAGFPVNVVTILLVYLGRMSATFSYRNSTVFGTTSGEAQLHYSSSSEIFEAISVSQTDSIAMAGTVQSAILSQTNSVATPQLTLPR
jgi:hypothetical protein